jgi:hypothetical protein
MIQMDTLTNRKNELSKMILTLEYDRKTRQINFALEKKLDNYKKELESIQEKSEKIET